MEKYQDKLEVDKIVIVNGPLQVNFEYGRKTVQARDIKVASISQVREQAEDLGLMDNRKRLMSIEANEKASMEESNETKLSNDNEKGNKEFDVNLENKINNQVQQKPESIKNENKYVVEIPSSAKKEDLHDLKSFLLEIKTGNIEVYILLK